MVLNLHKLTMGIGLALAKKFKSLGNNVIVTGRNEESLRGVCSEFGFEYIRGDLAHIPDLQELINQIQVNHPDLNVLVNNAGIQKNYQFANERNYDLDIEHELAVNLTAPLKLCSALLPALSRQEYGAIVNLSSVLALVPKQSAPVYCGSKAAIHIFTKALRYQLEGSTVKVFEIIPPLVDTAMTEGRGKGKMSPDDLAAEFLANFKRDRLTTYAGKAKILRAIQRLAPGIADRILKKKLSQKKKETSKTSINPTREITTNNLVQLFRVCFSVKPLSLATTQNPLSFIQEIVNEPNPIASNIRTGG